MSTSEADFWTLAATHQRFLKHKLCLAEKESDPCRSPIIKAHTIPRSQMSKIAEAGHVYSFDASMPQLEKSGGKIAIKKFGIGQFSVLNCFCARHDNQIFSDIEDIPLTFSPRQLALLHYRTVASELYRKIRMVEATSHQMELISKKLKSRKNREGIEFLKAFNDGQKLGMRDGRIAIRECERILDEQIYDRLSALIVRFDRLPTVMTVGGFFPEFDFDGRALQTLGREDESYEPISLNILVSEGRAAVAMIWLKGHDTCLAFARSYETKITNLYTTLAIQTSFEHLENTCVEPKWWNGLKQVERELLLRRMQIAGSTSEARESNCLQYTGVTYDDWDFDQLQYINV
jgi:hypothetical protein